MFGPVSTTMSGAAPPSSVSFGTNAPGSMRRSSTGWRPPEIAIGPAGRTTGRT